MTSAEDPIDYRALFTAIPTPYLVMTPDLVIVGANDAYLANVGRTFGELVGSLVFEAFPASPDGLDDNGVPRVQVSFERARDTGLVDVMPMQQYDVPDAASGGLSRRFWSLLSVPIMAADGTCTLVVQRAEDITDVVLNCDEGGAAEQGARWQRRVHAANGPQALVDRLVEGLVELIDDVALLAVRVD